VFLEIFINYYLSFFGMPGVIANLSTSNIFLSVLLAGSISQLIKIMLLLIRSKQEFNINDLIVTGGIPSTHSAMVAALTTIIWLNQGFSPLFFVVFTFSLIILRDAMGVRRSVGEEGKVIEKLIKRQNMIVDKFHYSLGHTPLEVLSGIIIGLISAIFSYSVF
jgi:hypothetical protein